MERACGVLLSSLKRESVQGELILQLVKDFFPFPVRHSTTCVGGWMEEEEREREREEEKAWLERSLAGEGFRVES